METERGEETEEVGYGSAHHSADFGGRKKKKKSLDDTQMDKRKSSCSESMLYFHWPKKMQESLNP